LPLAPAPDGLIVTIKLTPRARSSAIDGIVEEPGPEGARPVLRVRVTAPPEAGKPNAAMIPLLANPWRQTKRDLATVQGDNSRVKRVRIAGRSQALMRNIAERIGAP